MTGFKPSDLIGLPADERRLLTFLLRHRESSVDELARHLGIATSSVLALVETLKQRGLVTASGSGLERRYVASLGSTAH